METREHEDRTEALDHAVRHRLRDETANDVIKNAKKYFKFLRGEKEE